MINVRDLEITIGARVLMSGVTFQVAKGDKVGLVGRNGAGKTTLTKVIAGDMPPSAGTIDTVGEIGYLPQDPRSGDPNELAKDRILNARGLGTILAKLEQTRVEMGSVEEDVYDAAMIRYSKLEAQFEAAGWHVKEVKYGFKNESFHILL